MFVIENGFTYVAFLFFVAGVLVALEKYAKWKIFNWVPPIVWVYLLNMLFSTLGMFNSEGVQVAYSALKNNLLYAMIFVMLLRCDINKLAKLGGRIIAIFLTGSLTIMIGFILAFIIFKNALGGGEFSWGALAALCASWIGGSPNMAAMEAAFNVNPSAYGIALGVDTVYYSLWIALLLMAVKYAPVWNRNVKADTSALEAVAGTANAEIEKEKTEATSADWVFLIGLSLIVSAVSQFAGQVMSDGLKGMGLTMFDKGTMTTLFVTIIGLVAALTKLGKLPAVNELSNVYLYGVISLLASMSSLTDLVKAPMWIVAGLFVLIIHVVLMYIASRIFHWDACLVSTASLANIGGSASAPLVASAYNPSYAGIGVLMGVLGGAVGNFFGLAVGYILRMLI